MQKTRVRRENLTQKKPLAKHGYDNHDVMVASNNARAAMDAIIKIAIKQAGYAA